jgi:hypothetical protein
MTIGRDVAAEQSDIERRLLRLKLLDGLRWATFPVAALASWAAGASPLAFPLAAAVGAAVVIGANLFSQRERRILTDELHGLERHGVAGDVVRRFSAEINRLTVGGSSN